MMAARPLDGLTAGLLCFSRPAWLGSFSHSINSCLRRLSAARR